jgi:glycosyltransferase involved in cell wall biosynthesis
MTTTLLLDLSGTAHTTARTGIQRVCRALPEALRAGGGNPLAVTHDPYAGGWRLLAGWERANLESSAPARRRKARWPWPARLAGWGRRGLGGIKAPPRADALLMPEIFSPVTARALPALFARTSGPRVALFHDAIALQLPELTPPGTVGRFPGYLRQLLAFDGIAAVSEDSRRSLLEYWRWAGFSGCPPVVAIPLGVDPLPPVASTGPERLPATDPVVLCVGSLEGRKNHLALLEAVEMLWARNIRFQLRLIGLVQPQTGREGLARLRQLQAAGRPLRFDGPVDEATLHAAYGECAFTVYPSLREGFGLPVLESLLHGKPCVCSARGALGESARGGGCLALEAVDAPDLAAALSHLLTQPDERARLAAAAGRRVFKPWPAHAAELLTWMRTLPRRASPFAVG